MSGWKNDRSGVYLIVNVKTEQFYIGSTVALRAREHRHLDDLANGTHRNPHLQSAYAKHGRDAFSFRIVAFVEPSVLLQVEQLCLDQLWDGGERCYNISRFADAPTRGRSLSDTHRRKLAEARRGKSRPLKGPRRPAPPVGEETRAKMRASSSCRNAKQHGALLAPDRTVYEIFNLARFAREHGLRETNLRAVLQGKRDTHLGWRRA